MAQKVMILVLALLILLSSVGMALAIDSRVTEVEVQMATRFYEQKQELEEIKKKQRITAQDVMILEKKMEEKK